MRRDARIYVAGHRGMVGSAITRRLKADGYQHLVLRDHSELDLTNQAAVEAFFAAEKPEFVFLAAARVGQPDDNRDQPADFMHTNTLIGLNVIHASFVTGVRKLVHFADPCVFPPEAPRPVNETTLLTGAPDTGMEGYALAKIATIKYCQFCNDQYGTDFVTLVPAPLFGPGETFSLSDSDAVAGLIRRFHDARENQLPQVTLWGTGMPRQEFLFVDDLADAALFFMQRCHARQVGSLINVGSGEDISYLDLAEMIKKVVGYRGRIVFENARSDGADGWLADVSRLQTLGWQPTTSLQEGLEKTYRWFLRHLERVRTGDETA